MPVAARFCSGTTSSHSTNYSYYSYNATTAWTGNASLAGGDGGISSQPTPPAVVAMIALFCIAAATTNGGLVLACCLSRAWREHVPPALLYMFCVGCAQGCAQLAHTFVDLVAGLPGAPCAATHALSAMTTYAGIAALPTTAIGRAVGVRWPHASPAARRSAVAVAACAQIAGAFGLALPPALGVYPLTAVPTACGGAVVYSLGALLALLGWTATCVAAAIGAYGWLVYVALSRHRRRRRLVHPEAAATQQKSDSGDGGGGGGGGGMSRVARRGTINMAVTSALYVCLMVPFAATLPLSLACQGGLLSPSVSCPTLHKVSGAAGALLELSILVNPLVYTLLTPQLRALVRAACCRRCRVAASARQGGFSER